MERKTDSRTRLQVPGTGRPDFRKPDSMSKEPKESRNHAVPETGKRDSRNQKACMFKGTKDSRKMADPGTGGTDVRSQKA